MPMGVPKLQLVKSAALFCSSLKKDRLLLYLIPGVSILGVSLLGVSILGVFAENAFALCA
jgi:hypothetical protein